jgi:hypothetical protein
MSESRSTLDDETDDEGPGDAREACYFWDVRAGECHYEMLFLGCEPCASCPDGEA